MSKNEQPSSCKEERCESFRERKKFSFSLPRIREKTRVVGRFMERDEWRGEEKGACESEEK